MNRTARIPLLRTLLLLLLLNPAALAQLDIQVGIEDAQVPITPSGVSPLVDLVLGFAASPPLQTRGFEIGLSYDPSVLTIDSISTAGILTGVQPAFFEGGFGSGEITWGCLYDFDLNSTIELGSYAPVVSLSVRASPGAVAGTSTQLIFTPVGDPQVETGLFDGTAIWPATTLAPPFSGTLEFALNMGEFIRADCDDSGHLGILDAIKLLEFLFFGISLECNRCGDVDASGTLEIVDAIALLTFLFLGGAPPAAPFPECGVPSETTTLSCKEFNSCP